MSYSAKEIQAIVVASRIKIEENRIAAERERRSKQILDLIKTLDDTIKFRAEKTIECYECDLDEDVLEEISTHYKDLGYVINDPELVEIADDGEPLHNFVISWHANW